MLSSDRTVDDDDNGDFDEPSSNVEIYLSKQMKGSC
jgi:hypothetical protein